MKPKGLGDEFARWVGKEKSDTSQERAGTTSDQLNKRHHDN